MRQRRWLLALVVLAAVVAVLVSMPAGEPTPEAPGEGTSARSGGQTAPITTEATHPAPAGDIARTAAAVDGADATVVCEVVRSDLEPFPAAVVAVNAGTTTFELRTADELGLVHVVVRGGAPAKVSFAAGSAELCGREVTAYSLPGQATSRVQLRLQERDAAVRGVVTDMHDQPLANARVSWRRDETPAACDATGRFELRVPSTADDFRCLFLAPGFRSHRENVMLSPGASVQLHVRLQPGPRIRGRVIDADGGPVIGAIVETILQRISGTPAITDETGDYELDCTIEMGSKIQVAVSCAGFVPASAHVAAVSGDATCDFTLQRASLMRGTVRRPDGQPAAGATVRIDLHAVFGKASESTTADEHGSFVLDELAPGSHQLRALCSGFPPASASVVVTAGTATDVTIHLAAGVTVRGCVVDDDGRAVRGAWVMHDAANVCTDARGRFELAGLPVDTAIAADLMSRDHVARRAVPLTTTADNRIELVRAGTLRGMVVDAHTGAGLDDFTITIVGGDYQQGSIGVDWGRDTGKRFQRTAGHWASHDLMLVPGSEWLVRVSAPGYATVVRKVVAHLDATILDVARMTAGVNVKGRLVTKATGSATGHAEVRLLDRAPGQMFTERYEPRARSGDDGTFLFAAVPPGQVWLAIAADGMPPQTLGPFAVGAVDCQLGDLVLGDGAAIVGTLFDAEGRPAGNRKLHAGSVHADGTTPRYAEAKTRADGTFVLAGLTPGTWRLTASIATASDAVPIAIDHRVRIDGGEQRIEVRPAGHGIVRGEVRGTWPADEPPIVVLNRIDDARQDATLGFSASAGLREGAFAIGGLASGRYEICVMAQRRFARAAVTVVSGTETAPVVLELDKR